MRLALLVGLLLVSFMVPTSTCGQTLSCGQVVNGTFSSLGQIVTYSFDGNSDDVIRISSIGTSGGVQPDVSVFNPSGIKVGGFGFNDGFSTLKLTNSGSYTVWVFDRNNSHVGNFNLCLVYTTPKCSAIPLACGAVLTNTFTGPTQQHIYSLSAVAGNVIRLSSVSKTGGVQPDIDIFNMAGNYIGGFGYNDGINTFTFTDSGNYIVIVRDRSNSRIGDYSIIDSCIIK